MRYVLAIDQSTSATKAILFDRDGGLGHRVSVPHRQIYPHAGWVEHDPHEIFENCVSAIAQVVEESGVDKHEISSLALTNQRETAVVWNRHTGRAIANAVVWQCQRGEEICRTLNDSGHGDLFKEKTGLLIDPYFSASGVKWLLDNTPGAREAAGKGDLLMGTIDSWLIWNFSRGTVHATDYTNASRTLLFNVHTLDWDNELFELFDIPLSMAPVVMPCDSVFAETDANGFFEKPIPIAGVMGDSHGALAGQMCFREGMGKATYGTGSSVMINIGEKFRHAAPGLVTSVGFAACGKVFYAFEGNIHCTGATLKWLSDELQLIGSPAEVEEWATKIADNAGVYLVPAFAGLGAPWWDPSARAAISGLTLGTGKAHVVRAALEAIAYQVKDLVDGMTGRAGIALEELRVDGGPTKNRFLMQFQADMLGSPINVSPIEEASALGAVVMNGLARGAWHSLDEAAAIRTGDRPVAPQMARAEVARLHGGWLEAVRRVRSDKA